MSAVIHVGDTGTVFESTVKDQDNVVVPLGTATTLQMTLTPPAGAALTKTASLVTDGSDGKVRYTTIAGDLSLAGVWSRQVYVVTPAGAWHGDVSMFSVEENL
jgi:hypothetical protein